MLWKTELNLHYSRHQKRLFMLEIFCFIRKGNQRSLLNHSLHWHFINYKINHLFVMLLMLSHAMFLTGSSSNGCQNGVLNLELSTCDSVFWPSLLASYFSLTASYSSHFSHSTQLNTKAFPLMRCTSWANKVFNTYYKISSSKSLEDDQTKLTIVINASLLHLKK